VKDLGDISFKPDVKIDQKKLHELDIYQNLGRLNSLLSETIAKSSADALTLVLGGDHSLGTGSVHGSLLKHGDELKVVWIDAHADINTPRTSLTKNYHGMPVAHITGLFEDQFTGYDWLTKRLKMSNLVYIGIRDLDEAEKKFIADNQIKAFSPYEIDRLGGMENTVNEAFQYLGLDKRKAPIHVSFDVDSADAEVIGGTGTPSRFGLTAREINHLMRRLHRSECMVHMDVAEVNKALPDDKPYVHFHGDNPDIHTDSLTVYNTCEFLHYAFGKTHVDYIPHQCGPENTER
jgi:arginase